MKDHLVASTEREVVEAYLSFYNTFQISEMMDLFTEDCLFQNISQSSINAEANGKEELFKLASEGAKLFQERKQTVTNWIVSKEKVAVEINYTATLALDLPNGLKKGSIIHLKGVSIYEFKNGKIKRLVDFS